VVVVDPRIRPAESAIHYSSRHLGSVS